MKTLISLIFIIAVGVGAYMLLEENRDTAQVVDTDESSNDEISPALHSASWVWIRTERADGSIIEAPAGKFVLSFDGERASSSTDCNSMSASYVIDGEVLSFGPIGSTKMYCEDSVETEYARDIALATSYVIEGDELRINLNRDVGVMYFLRQ